MDLFGGYAYLFFADAATSPQRKKDESIPPEYM